ncbi:MAG: endonuclease III [Candidatus Diapherotrites archaeon]|nr:endonuclease III [Candidatus Diapherotrites archaeon]
MNSKEFEKIFLILEKEVKKFKVPVAELVKVQSNSSFHILIATILSARTKDETTAKACEKLFKKIKQAKDFEKYSLKEIEKMSYPVGFYKTKAKHLKQLPAILEKEFNNKIPETLEELIKLPGVGRKTANLVLSVAFNKEGICVDTHVHRITNRLGYVKTKTPFETEMKLREKLPKKLWRKINYVLVAFGQNTCTPLSPKCSKCRIEKQCPKINVKKKR